MLCYLMRVLIRSEGDGRIKIFPKWQKFKSNQIDIFTEFYMIY